MTRKLKVRLITMGMLALFVAGAELAVGLGAGRATPWVVRGVMWILGLVAAAIVFRILSPGGKKTTPADPVVARIDGLFAEASRRLSAAGIARGRISRLPVVLLIGPTTGGKTTLIARSEIGAELLAGEVQRDGTVVPTDGLNLWYGGDALFVDVAGGLLENDAGWARVIRHLKQNRLAAALGWTAQAPRVTVLCYPCSALVARGGADSVSAAGQSLNERLLEISKALGVHLPVYVVFAKADQLPHFEDYTRTLTAAEIDDVLGATLPVAETAVGVRIASWAERQVERLSIRFEGLYRSLADRRPEIMGREADVAARHRLYEFPRAFAKTSTLVVDFLVELSRPSQLNINPVLRGFYFTGVRPVVVETEAGPVPARGSEGRTPLGATMLFDGTDRSASQASPATGTRRVPQWVFLRRLFADVLLGDAIARELTGSGTRVSFLRRAAAGGAGLLCFVLVIGLTTSFVANRRLQGEVEAALQKAATIQDVRRDSPPRIEDMRGLDALGAELRRLRAYRVGHPPLKYRWGLYRGGDLLPWVRAAYFDRFEPHLGRPARDLLVDDLELAAASATTAASAGPDYRTTFDALKAYLIITDYGQHAADSSTAEFLAPVLLERRLRGHESDSTSRDLAGSQFALYAVELKHGGDPFGWITDQDLVDSTRQYLSAFKGEDKLYGVVINAATRVAGPIPFDSDVLNLHATIPGAFTRQGWDYMHSDALTEDLEAMLSSARWVTGGRDLSDADYRAARVELLRRYKNEYEEAWLSLLRSARITGMRGFRQAAGTVSSLGSNTSPLLSFLYEVSRNTNVDSLELGRTFQPVHVVMPPDTTDLLIVEANSPYMEALASLAEALEAVDKARQTDRDAELQGADDAATRVSSEARSLQQDFGRESAADALVFALLRSPAVAVQRLVGGAQAAAAGRPREELAARLRQFCTDFEAVTEQYPFDWNAGLQASPEKVDGFLRPGEGRLWVLASELETVDERGGEWHRASGLGPSRGFVRMLNEASRITEALYARDGVSLTGDFSLRVLPTPAVPTVHVAIDGREISFEVNRNQARRFTWHAGGTSSARIRGGVAGDALSFDGPWSTFRLFQEGDWTRQGDNSWTVRWHVSGATVTGTLEPAAPSDVSLLNPRQWPRLVCDRSVSTE